jgi:hypothetical protein
MTIINQCFFLAICIILGTFAQTQGQVNLNKWQIGVNGGVMIYQGDLTPEGMGSYRTVQPTLGLYASRVINRSFLLRTNIAVGQLKGNDSIYEIPVWRKERNYRFTSPIVEISELLVWNIAGNNQNELGQRFSPYMFAGIGVSFLKVRRDHSNFNTHYFASATNLLNGLTADSLHMPPRATMVLPVGIGMEFYLTPKLSITAETSLRYAFTDYLDGFSLGANPKRKDAYHSHTIGLLYRFGGKNELDCPALKP